MRDTPNPQLEKNMASSTIKKDIIGVIRIIATNEDVGVVGLSKNKASLRLE